LVEDLNDGKPGGCADGRIDIADTEEHSDQEAERHNGIENDGPHHGAGHLLRSIGNFVTEMENAIKS
jgi:hypothetical protein